MVNGQQAVTLFLSLLILYPAATVASHGDMTLSYQRCTAACRSLHACPLLFSDVGWALGSCFWCKHDCMWQTVSSFVRHGHSTPQFHGKWPFYSTRWAQEPASAACSVLNLAAVNAMRLRVQQLGEGNEEWLQQSVMKRVWIAYTILGCIAWLCSTWFHAMDYFWSERADYFAAFAFVLFANFAAINFVFPTLRRGWQAVGLSTLFLLFYLNYVRNMWNNFDYGWNMALCIGCSVATLFTYLFYLFRRWRQFGSVASLRQSDRLLLLVLAWSIAAVSLELHDFVPWYYTIDSHALFHAATVPLPLLTARFIETHARESGFEYAKIV